MKITIWTAVMSMAAYFLILYGAVGFIQDKRFFSSAPKEVLAVIPDRKERFRGAHAPGWTIEALTRDKTIIMIAHRLKTVRNADRILVIDHGRIVQQGKHEQLISEPGIYADFVGGKKETVGWKL